jgi:hypothetical protein
VTAVLGAEEEQLLAVLLGEDLGELGRHAGVDVVHHARNDREEVVAEALQRVRPLAHHRVQIGSRLLYSNQATM